MFPRVELSVGSAQFHPRSGSKILHSLAVPDYILRSLKILGLIRELVRLLAATTPHRSLPATHYRFRRGTAPVEHQWKLADDSGFYKGFP